MPFGGSVPPGGFSLNLTFSPPSDDKGGLSPLPVLVFSGGAILSFYSKFDSLF